METRFIVAVTTGKYPEFFYFSSYDDMMEEIEVKGWDYDNLEVFERIEFP